MFGCITFYKIQIFLAIRKVYHCHQMQILNSTNSVVQAIGDGRCDSPNYSAKYGTYSVMEHLKVA